MSKMFFLAGLLGGVLAACSTDDSETRVSNTSYPICLSGSMANADIAASTRAALDGSSTSSLPVSFIRRDQKSAIADTYPSYVGVSPVKATLAAVAGNTPGAITFASGSEQYYLTRETNNNTALMGWYPQVGSGSTYDSTSGKVTFTITSGTTDVMLTKEQTGNKTTGVSSFVFEHVLAQVKVQAKAVDAAAAANWGKVTGVTLKGVNTTCVVTLPTTTALASTLLTPTFGTPGNLALKAIGSDSNTTLAAAIPATAGTTGTPFCYGLFPPTGGNTLKLDVITDEGGTRADIPVTLASGTITKGNIYTITLEFKATDIASTATISSWGTGSGANVSM